MLSVYKLYLCIEMYLITIHVLLIQVTYHEYLTLHLPSKLSLLLEDTAESLQRGRRHLSVAQRDNAQQGLYPRANLRHFAVRQDVPDEGDSVEGDLRFFRSCVGVQLVYAGAEDKRTRSRDGFSELREGALCGVPDLGLAVEDELDEVLQDAEDGGLGPHREVLFH